MYGGLQNPSTMCYLNAFVQILRVMHRHKNISHSSKLCTLLTNMEFLKLSDPVPFTLTLTPLFHPESGQQDVLELMTHFFCDISHHGIERRTHRRAPHTLCRLCNFVRSLRHRSFPVNDAHRIFGGETTRPRVRTDTRDRVQVYPLPCDRRHHDREVQAHG